MIFKGEGDGKKDGHRHGNDYGQGLGSRNGYIDLHSGADGT